MQVAYIYIGAEYVGLSTRELNIIEKAAGALGSLNDTRAVEPLIQALNDEYPLSKRLLHSLSGGSMPL